ncbi:MAG: hypothetical protein HYZ28_07150 [Myxococcales bacterium]|nr:hypothetical protein [Myxococcales bacterium]
MSTLPRPAALFAALSFAACGPPQEPPPPDAGPDTSCGIDCTAQERYGLTVSRCFEYSTTSAPANPAELGAIVKPVETLEGGLAVLPLEYRQSGQVKMTDYFAIRAGDLLLARRTFLPGQSVTYKDEGGNIAGAKWLTGAAASGESFTTSIQADVIGSGPRRTEPTTYRVSLAEPTTSEQTVPLQKFDSARKMLYSETPDHGADPRRLWVPGTGFGLFSTYFSPTAGGTAQEYRLQRIRDIGTPDGGTTECGLGSP